MRAAAPLVALAGAVALAHPGHPPIPPPTVAFGATRDAIPFELFRGTRIVLAGTVNGAATDDDARQRRGHDGRRSRRSPRSSGSRAARQDSVRGAGGEVPGEIVGGVTLTTGALRLTKLSVLVIDMAPVARGGRPADPGGPRPRCVQGGARHHRFPQPHDPLRSDARVSPAPCDAARARDDEGRPLPAGEDLGRRPAAGRRRTSTSATAARCRSPRNYWSSAAGAGHPAPRGSQTGGVGGLQARTPRDPARGRVRLACASTNVPATLNEDAKALPTSGGNVGIELLKPFVVTFDCAGGALYLQPTGHAPLVRTGARRAFAPSSLGDRLKVVYVSPGRPGGQGRPQGRRRDRRRRRRKGRTRLLSYRPDWTRRSGGPGDVALAKRRRQPP